MQRRKELQVPNLLAEAVTQLACVSSTHNKRELTIDIEAYLSNNSDNDLIVLLRSNRIESPIRHDRSHSATLVCQRIFPFLVFRIRIFLGSIQLPFSMSVDQFGKLRGSSSVFHETMLQEFFRCGSLYARQSGTSAMLRAQESQQTRNAPLRGP